MSSIVPNGLRVRTREMAQASPGASSNLAIAAAARAARRPQARSRSVAMRNAWRHSRTGLAVVLLLTAFLNVLKLTLPLYIFQLLDRVIASRSIDTLFLLTAITVLAVLAHFIRRSLARVVKGGDEAVGLA